ncbi:MAG: hypothetical protein OHK0012_03910 [Synechococcales cyanobacterium]
MTKPKASWALQLRTWHRTLAPVVLLPLIVTLLTGSLYQIASLQGNFDFYWLIEVHKGKYGPVDLTAIYPFLNAFGLLFMVSTGISMWWQWLQTQRRRSKTARPE